MFYNTFKLLIYFGEAWIYQNDSPACHWVSNTDLRFNPTNEDKHVPILHAGCEYGCLGECDLFLNSNN